MLPFWGWIEPCAAPIEWLNVLEREDFLDSLGIKMARTSVTDIHNRGVWVECNAIRLTNGIVHHEDRTRCQIVSVTGTWQLRRCVGKEIKPRIL